MAESPMQNIFFSVVRNVAQKGLDNQKVREGDYYDENGFLICGKCGKPRQTVFHYDVDQTEENTGEDLKVVTDCDCDKEIKDAEKKAEEHRKEIAQIERLKSASLMDEKFKNATFDNFSTNKYNERNLKICKRYVMKSDEMLANNQGLLFWGDVGTGKSYLAACIANFLLEKKISVVMTSLVKLLELIQEDYDSESMIIRRLNTAKFVIFDDLGAERSTDYALEKIYNIIDSRYRANKPMIFTTNLTISQMKNEKDIRYSRIYDRIFESCYPMQFTGTSWRKKAAADKFDKMKAMLEED